MLCHLLCCCGWWFHVQLVMGMLCFWLIPISVFQVQKSLLSGDAWHYHLQPYHARSNKSGQYVHSLLKRNSSAIQELLLCLWDVLFFCSAFKYTKLSTLQLMCNSMSTHWLEDEICLNQYPLNMKPHSLTPSGKWLNRKWQHGYLKK